MKVCPTCWELFPDSDESCRRCSPKVQPVRPEAPAEPISVSKLASVWKWVTLVSVVVTLWKGASNLYFQSEVWPSAPPPQVEATTKAASSSSWQLRFALHDDSVLPNFAAEAPYTDFASSVYVNVDGDRSWVGVSWTVFTRDGLFLMRNSAIENPETWTPSATIKVCVPADADGLCQYKYSAEPVVRNPVLDLAVLKIVGTYEEMSHTKLAGYASASQIAGKKLAYSAYSSVGITSAHRGLSDTSVLMPNGELKTSVFYFRWAEWGAVYDGSGSLVGIFSTPVPSDRELSFTPSVTIVDWLKSVTWKGAEAGYSKSDFEKRTPVSWSVWGMDSTLTPEYLSAHAVLDDKAASADAVVSAGKYVLSVRPQYAFANHRVWKAYVSLGKHAESVGYLWTAANLSPWSAEYLLDYANALFSSGAYEKCASVWNAAYALQSLPNSAKSEFLELAGLSYDKLWKTQERNLALSQAVSLDSANVSAMEAYSKFVLGGKLVNAEEQNRLCIEKLGPKSAFTGKYLANWQPNCECTGGAFVNSGKCMTHSDINAQSQMAGLERVETYKRLHFANRDPNVLSNDPDALRRDMDDIKKYAREDLETSWYVNNNLINEVRKYYVPGLRASK